MHRRLLLLLGVVLLALGLALWLATGRSSVTALIPSFFGAVFVLLAQAATRASAARAALRGGWLLAIVAALGGLGRGLPAVFRSFGGTPIERPAAIWGAVAMGVLCLVYAIVARPRKSPAA